MKSRLITAVCGLALTAAAWSPAMAASRAKASAPAKKAPVTANKGAELFKKLVAGEAKVKDYHVIYDYNETATDKDKGNSGRYEFWVKKPGTLKLVVLEGDNKGVKLSYVPDDSPDKVHVKKGMLPLPPMSKDDKRFEGFFQSTWAGDIDDLKGFAKGGSMKAAGSGKIKNRDADILEITTGPGAKFSKALAWIDKSTGVLLQYEYYVGKELRQKKTWEIIDIDKGLTNNDFKL